MKLETFMATNKATTLVTKTLGMMAATLIAGLTTTSVALADDELASIKAKGVLVVGAKTDYPPFSSTIEKDGTTTFVGFEADLAADIAKALGVSVKFVPVVSANRLELLKSGAIDVVIATLSVRPERKLVANLVEPNYYAGEQNVLAPKSAGLKDWKDLADKPVCGIQGAYYNATIQQVGGHLMPAKDTNAALANLKAGKCIAFVFDITLLEGIVAKPEWSDFTTPLPSINPEPWALAVKKEDTTLTPFLSDLIKGWHKDGSLIELEKKWGINPSPFLKAQHESAM